MKPLLFSLLASFKKVKLLEKFKKKCSLSNKMGRSNSIILIISGISFILLVVFLSLLLGNHLQVQSCECPKMVSQNFIVLFITLSVIFIGGLIYYLLSLKIERKDKKVKFNVERIMEFLV